ncbi:MAG: signal peptide peptidase SppA [Acidobacteria bacterium]|nr:signal peptide peptidase SppA [Acidobacteriota bacterium]
MKRWFWGFLTGVMVTLLLLTVASLLGWYLGERPPEVQPNTTLILEIQGDIPEQSPTDALGLFLEPRRPLSFIALLRQVEKAETDSRITAILLKPSQVQLGWAKLQQLRRSLEQFQRRGKPVLAALEVAGSKEYFLASVANKIYLSPVGFLNLKGMRAEVMFFKDTLTKLGVQADLERIGPYKNLADQFTENQMSDAFREVTNSLLDGIYGNFLTAVAASRHRSGDDLRALIEQHGPFEAERALQLGLVDELRYEDQVLEPSQEGNGKPGPTLDIHEYRRVPAPQESRRDRQRIALLYAVGSITAGEDEWDPLSAGKTLGAKTMESVAKSIAEDDSIRGVLVRIDSPGGDAFASENIWRSLLELRQKKPVVFSLSDTAASGGYLIAMTGDPLVAEATTLTGSIGIVYGKLNLKGLYDKLGVRKEIIRRGPFSAMDSDYGSYTPQERERVRALMQDFYGKFLAHVAEARKMTPEEVYREAQVLVWTGEQAQRNRLVDDIGGLPRALEILREKAGIAPEASVELVEYPRKKSLWEVLISRIQAEQVRLPVNLGDWMAQWERFQELSQHPAWARLPWEFDFR